TYQVVTGPSHGTLSGTAPNLIYTPFGDYYGPDSFTYKVNDGTVDSNVATVSVNVTPVNDPPVASSQSASTNEDVPYSGTVTGTDVDSSALTYSVVSSPAHGSVSMASNGSYTYTPAANYFGPDSFTFRASDGTSTSNTATVSITVVPVNDAPVANDDRATA